MIAISLKVLDTCRQKLASMGAFVKIKALTSQIQSDTTIIKDNTTRTLQAITGDRTQDAGQFSSLATGGGFTMSQAPDFGAILQGRG